MVLLVVALAFLLYQVSKFCSTKFNKCNKLFAKLSRYLFYKAPIRYIIVSYLRVLSVFASLVYVGFAVKTHYGYLILYGLITGILILWPVGVIGFMLKNNDKIDDKEFRGKYDALYQGIKTTSWQALVYNAVFAVRRFDIILDNLLLN